MQQTIIDRRDWKRVGGRGALAGFAGLALALGALFVSAPEAAAQNSNDGQVPLQTYVLRDDGVAQQLPSRPSSFNLFAEEDLAGTSLRATGSYRYALVNAGGLCPFARTGGDIFNTLCGNATSNTFFHATATWGVGIEEYRKIREIHPGIANMRPPVGYSTPWRRTSIAPITIRIGPADGQFGRYFAGAVSELGEGCREFTGANGAGLPQNFTLLAASDCPETWAANGFEGVRHVTNEQWLSKFQTNPSEFRWDSHRMEYEPDADVLGNLASYGAFSDFPREVVQLYGGVTPRGSGPPRERGFPLGIEIRVDAWKFDRPSVRDGVYIRWLVINRSDAVWGQGIDYDKLYLGIDPGYVLGGQRPSAHNFVEKGVHIASGRPRVSGWSGNCNSTTYPRKVLPGANQRCHMNSSGGTPRFIMVLKSPLGDLKNKLFTDPESPYFFPSHPAAGDTITFNHWRKGDFGSVEQWAWGRSDRAMYGFFSGDEDLFLDGRQPDFMSAYQIWNYFRYEFTDGTTSPANWRWNRSVPSDIPGYGAWDYNHDGVPDTLKLPDCGSVGCSRPWGDTIAGGFSYWQAGNIGNFLGMGPFALAAGDTTEILWYMGSPNRNDTLRVNTLIDNAISTYYNNYAGAASYPAPVITASDIEVSSAWLRDSTVGSQNTNIRIQVRMPPRQDDQFLANVLERLESDEPIAVTLRNLNPDLVETVRGRMRQNLAHVLVFKSCDNGSSWTSDGGCTSAVSNFRTRDDAGGEIGHGWRYRFRLNADSITGDLSSNSISENVQSGREYLYSFVTVTRSLEDIEVILDQTTNAEGHILSQTTGDLQGALNVDIDSISSGLRPAGPATARVYAPISPPAGTIYARLDSARTQQEVVTNRVSLNPRQSDLTGTFRMRFGNRFVITRTLDTVSGAQTSTVIRQSVYPRGAISPADPVVDDFVASADTFTSNTDFTYSSNNSGALSTVPTSVTGSVQTFVDTVSRAGYVIAQGSGGNAPHYLAVSSGSGFLGSNLTQSTAVYEGQSHYPGFTATVVNETAPPSTRISRVIRAPGDSLNTGVVNSNGVVYQTTSVLYSPGGWYKLRWQGDAHGPQGESFFRIAPAVELQPVLDASLAARPVATTGVTDESIRSMENFPSGTRPLIPVRVPFQVIGIEDQPAQVAMFQRHTSGNVSDSLLRNSRLWGTSGDTVRLQIGADMWMPGDTLYVLENIWTDSTATVGGEEVHIVRDTTINGRTQRLPIRVSRQIVGMRLTLACASNVTPTRNTCNPIALGTPGSSGYLPFSNGFESAFLLNRPFDQNSEIELSAQPLQASALPLRKIDMDRISVVPNPFVVQSAFSQLSTGRAVIEDRIRFVNVPTEGMVRIYSVSGQLIQQITWTQDDLIASGAGSPHGDLPYNLRTREGLDLGPGLYVYVLTARGANANGQVARGKFVVIR